MSRSVVYTLHLWPPLGHAGHYTGKPESSRFLKAQLAAVNRKLAELSGLTGASLCPVQLRLGDGELATVGLGVGTASLVAPRVAEDPA
jgi:hypothetical protein